MTHIIKYPMAISSKTAFAHLNREREVFYSKTNTDRVCMLITGGAGMKDLLMMKSDWSSYISVCEYKSAFMRGEFGVSHYLYQIDWYKPGEPRSVHYLNSMGYRDL